MRQPASVREPDASAGFRRGEAILRYVKKMVITPRSSSGEARESHDTTSDLETCCARNEAAKAPVDNSKVCSALLRTAFPVCLLPVGLHGLPCAPALCAPRAGMDRLGKLRFL